MPYAIDLFSGAGGMSEGLIQAGFHILFSSDKNDQVELTYKNRHEQLGYLQGVNTHYECMDIRELTGQFIMNRIAELKDESIPAVPHIDAIFGGPPCQGFSLAGRRNQNDPRNFLFKEYLRVINEIRPSYVVMENVEGFISTTLFDFEGCTGKVYKGKKLITSILLNEFTEIGYETLEPQLLNASQFGVPQKRQRAIFIAYLPNCNKPSYPAPNCKDNVCVREAIGDLISNSRKRKRYNSNLTDYQIESKNGRTPNIEGITIQSKTGYQNYEFSNHEPLIVERFSLYRKGERTNQLRNRIMIKGISLQNKQHLIRKVKSYIDQDYTDAEIISTFRKGNATSEMVEAILTKKNNRQRIDPEDFSPTVLTLPDDLISPYEDRIMTVRELARLQSFDDSFVFLGKRTTGGLRRKVEVPQYSQVGNAVPPLLAKAVAEQIKIAIEIG